MELIGLYFASCALLVVAGAAKVLKPADTARGLAASLSQPAGAGRIRRLSLAVRVGSFVETALGLAALVYLSVGLAVAVAVSYGCFCAFVIWARHRGGPLSTCGCFGTPDTPPTGLHLVLDGALALSAVWVAADGARGWSWTWLTGQPWHGVPLVLLSVALAWFVGLCLTGAARLLAVRRLLARVGSQDGVTP